MKYQVLFSLTNNEKVFMNVVCCSRDWRFKGKPKQPDKPHELSCLLAAMTSAKSKPKL